MKKKFITYQVAYLLLLAPVLPLSAQTGSIYEPVRYIGGKSVDPSVHDGRLRYAIGVESRQTMRANKSINPVGEYPGWTYNHASNLAYWKGRFYQHYLSNPIYEHIPPGQTLLISSEDGRNWSEPSIIFPPYQAPEGVKLPEGTLGYMMHQRMGFYITSNDRLLLLAFYGHAEDPFTTGGIGRVVREIYADQSLGPIYFIRYDSHTDWNETNTSYPFYKNAPDQGFIEACDELLNNKLVTLQWWDEDHGVDGFYKVTEAKEALSYYHRKDGNVVALWKRSFAALSFDGGTTFSQPTQCPTLVMAGGKVWGQKTDDNRYALCYNPINMDEHRYPLTVISGDDGIVFDDMLIVQGEVPPRRFFGRWKDYGPCYTRGIVEGNGNPPGDDMWITYSMNKEDMWVSRIPVPIRHQIEGELHDDFENMHPGGTVDQWNVYAPLWAPIEVITHEGNQVLQLKDKDPYDYARAIRVFEEQTELSLKMKIMTRQNDHGLLEIDINDQFGNRPVQIKFDRDG
ncbi:MAG: hypothetical protein KDC53_20915, partial [Saprospiraceae bacterium]|nr:hypothetical protein [Saprospiraceae bacterium]